MSHHIHMLPQLLPLEQPLKPDKLRKKRRLRGASSADAADDADEIDGVFAAETPTPRSRAPATPLEEDTGEAPALSHFSGPAMKAMLQAQEDAS